jgi:hypothetical protein
LAQLELEPNHHRIVDTLERELRSSNQLSLRADLRLVDEVIRLQENFADAGMSHEFYCCL